MEDSNESSPPGLLISERVLGPIHYRIVALCLAGTFDFLDLILYTFLLVPIARELHLDDTESSFGAGLVLRDGGRRRCCVRFSRRPLQAQADDHYVGAAVWNWHESVRDHPFSGRAPRIIAP